MQITQQAAPVLAPLPRPVPMQITQQAAPGLAPLPRPIPMQGMQPLRRGKVPLSQIRTSRTQRLHGDSARRRRSIRTPSTPRRKDRVRPQKVLNLWRR